MSQTKTFENNLSQLADIISKMEQSDVGLEESLKLYEHGIKMTRECQKIIDAAEKKIESLMTQQTNN
ncbi:exodeoxyribonuclease VII small subunit [Marinicella litoralis]|uniref:Exodeoxyribonuclease 7 small subunit n=1 Tax=Marinicella litoralis TaxID=644220 RepID=A0A4R6XW71_9GAMM|nr:exodeoxyribonuclease VII small subunit [Marinicella litoralis]TDR22819.1 exodeoxyribonuclease VII small subunit [Marinicella litoralis]